MGSVSFPAGDNPGARVFSAPDPIKEGRSLIVGREVFGEPVLAIRSGSVLVQCIFY